MEGCQRAVLHLPVPAEGGPRCPVVALGPAAPPTPSAGACLLDGPQPSQTLPVSHFPAGDQTALLAGCFPTFNWGYKRHLSQYKKIDPQVGGPRARWSPTREEQQKDGGKGSRVVGVTGAPGGPGSLPFPARGVSPLPCAASYLAGGARHPLSSWPELHKVGAWKWPRGCDRSFCCL